jgi:hypothetical protein
MQIIKAKALEVYHAACWRDKVRSEAFNFG